MDMFDLFREPDDKTARPSSSPDSDSPPIQSSNEDSLENSAPYSGDETEISRPASPFSSTLPPASKVAMDKSLVLSIPGSLVFRKHAFQLSWLTSLAKSVEELREAGYNVALVVGESPDVRAAAHAGRQLGIPHAEIESATRASSQLHAALVLRTLAQAHPQVCDSLPDTVSLLQQGLVPVMLGSKDTLSTEARAAMLAEAVGARFVLFTELDVPANTITHSRFSRMAGEAAFRSNQEFIVDPLTALILARAKIDTFLVSEKSVGKLSELMDGNSKLGTRITSTEQLKVRSIARGELPREMPVREDREEFDLPPREPEPVLPTFSRSIPREENPDDPPSPGRIARDL